jgi:hypothetical protein
VVQLLTVVDAAVRSSELGPSSDEGELAITSSISDLKTLEESA